MPLDGVSAPRANDGHVAYEKRDRHPERPEGLIVDPEREGPTWDGLLAAPVDRALFWAARTCSTFLFLAAVQVVALLLAALIAAYAATRLVALPPLYPEREPLDAIGLVTVAVEAVGVLLALRLTRASFPALRPQGEIR